MLGLKAALTDAGNVPSFGFRPVKTFMPFQGGVRLDATGWSTIRSSAAIKCRPWPTVSVFIYFLTEESFLSSDLNIMAV